MPSTNTVTTRSLGVFSLTMLNVAAILNLRILPIMAVLGWNALFFYALALLLFLVPSGFVCATLASRYPQNGGVYSWVSAAFGDKCGLCAIWMEWINNVIAFPATLAVIVTTLAYSGLMPVQLSPFVLFIAMMSILWGVTAFNLLGLRASTVLTTLGAIVGVFLPTLLLIILAACWLLLGHTASIHLSLRGLLPDWHWRSLVMLVAAMSAYSGMQVAGFHASQVKRPTHTFPRAILISGAIIFGLTCLGSLAIAMVIPKETLHLTSGVVAAFSVFFSAFHLGWMTPILAACIALGAVASLSAWLIGPAKGVAYAAKQGVLPAVLAKHNGAAMPVVVMIAQSAVATGIATLFLVLPSIKRAFWVLIALTSQFTVLMYVFIFLAAICLYYRSMASRGDSILGGHVGMVAWAGVGVVACLGAFMLGVLPPNLIHYRHVSLYVTAMILGDGVIIALPLLWLYVRSIRRHSPCDVEYRAH